MEDDSAVSNALRGLEQDFERNLRLNEQQQAGLRVKCEFNGESRVLNTFARPLKLTDLRNELQARYKRRLDIYFTMPNGEIDVPVLSQDDLDLVVRIIDHHQNLRSLRLLLRVPPDADDTTDGNGRCSPPPGTLPPGAEFHDTASQMTASTYSEGEFIPEDRDTDSLSSVSESRQSLDTFQIRARGLGSRASVHSDSAVAMDDMSRRGGPGGTFPRRNVVHIDDGRASVPRTMQRTRTPAEVAAANRRDFPRADSLGSAQRSPAAPDNWKQGDLLGQGAFGKVYKCHDQDSGRLFAMKVVQLDANQDPATSREVKALEIEIQTLKKFSHERIVQYLGYHQDAYRLCIFMEYMDCGSLRDEIKRFGPIREILARKYTRMVLEGLSFLHRNTIVHRDIKGANILKDSQGNVKLSDFGSAKHIKTLQSAMSTKFAGTAPYIAPEVIRGKKYHYKADIWSLGSTVVEFLTGHPPYHQLENAVSVIYRIVSDQKVDYTLPSEVTETARQFIDACFTHALEQRPDADSLLRHRFCTEAL
ncbi:hypothetical protein BOX15_Mlig024460g1 [Macrostomum lignano]|uniref:Protein kinase domain-containing protein n=2 Tax=Macrostomum lignano TaxID=282301 RepID=A0A267FTA2_9PLAT|nr:hypothetical protein BOX15_Mlig024460g1 [Macrostomum lignano]